MVHGPDTEESAHGLKVEPGRLTWTTLAWQGALTLMLQEEAQPTGQAEEPTQTQKRTQTQQPEGPHAARRPGAH